VPKHAPSLHDVESRPELATPHRIPTLGQFQVCRGTGRPSDCQGPVESFQRYDRPGLRTKMEQLMRDAGLGAKVKVMVAADDKVPYLHLISTLDTVIGSCADPQRKVCLHNPSVGDIGLLRAEGFTTFE